ncbi:hypothetical protein SAMD00019534_008710 [Acytostelium subglobosum LB1]|uniref:hypothetical protein n=1 Tax=Acytostelium subglobosum LB1 TaxID=1410327 RepID=UPI000644A6B1|nr:hypothetical protein SAMD00019534_008710 [Acytostelium subglobosum LB1]GAM17696.1 hypothetical protein SAMD00019534_008710 [Acytostelium subglobosum LB1]|eukprot:XP_012758292.1 hypothetical protein SAMD00019534_008710 [Acytostelium subglobosum LB1]
MNNINNNKSRSNILFITILFLVLATLANVTQSFPGFFELDSKSNERALKGKDELESLLTNSKKSKCWEQCMESLVHGCKEMDDVQRSRLAVKLASCHLEKSGLTSYQCTDKMSIPECTSSMSELAYMTYTNFYISTENICYYLQSELFQQQTEKAVNKLIESTVDTLTSVKQIYLQSQLLSESMEQTNLAQQKLVNINSNLKMQLEQSMDFLNRISVTSEELKSNLRETIVKQDTLLESQVKLSEQQQQSSRASLDILFQIKDSANFISSNTLESLDNQNRLLGLQKQAIGDLSGIGSITDQCLSKQREILNAQDKISQGHQLIVSILNGLNNLSNTILSEFIDLKSIIYYAATSVLLFFITSTKRSAPARLPLYIGLITSMMLERYAISVSSHSLSGHLMDILGVNSMIDNVQFKYFLVSRIRMLFFACASMVVTLSIWFYRDYELLNHQLLLQLNESSKRTLLLLKSSNKSVVSSTSRNKKKEQQHMLAINIDDDVDVDVDYESDGDASNN